MFGGNDIDYDVLGAEKLVLLVHIDLPDPVFGYGLTAVDKEVNGHLEDDVKMNQDIKFDILLNKV